jgi:hypothetical protein
MKPNAWEHTGPNGLLKLLTIAETASLIQQSPGTLASWRCAGKGPAFYKLGRKILYSEVDVLAWIANQRVEPLLSDQRSKPTVEPVNFLTSQVVRKYRLGGHKTQRMRREERERSEGDR